MYYGYARDTSIEKVDKQIERLREEGIEMIFSDRIKKGSGYDALMSAVKSGDTIVVTDLSRLTRNISFYFELQHRNIKIVDLSDIHSEDDFFARFQFAIKTIIMKMDKDKMYVCPSCGLSVLPVDSDSDVDAEIDIACRKCGVKMSMMGDKPQENRENNFKPAIKSN